MKAQIKFYGFWDTWRSNNCFLKHRLDVVPEVKEIRRSHDGMGIKEALDIYKERLFE